METRTLSDAEATMISIQVASVISIAADQELDAVVAWRRIARDQLVRLDTVGCLLDPTGYRAERPEAEATALIAEAWLAFVQTVHKVKAR